MIRNGIPHLSIQRGDAILFNAKRNLLRVISLEDVNMHIVWESGYYNLRAIFLQSNFILFTSYVVILGSALGLRVKKIESPIKTWDVAFIFE